MQHIFDVSAYQGPTLRQCDAALVKASEGKSYTSSTFSKQWASAKTQAKRRGGYHFARPEESSARDQCDRFLDILQPVPGEMVMLDLEASKLSQAATNAWARDFGDRLRDQVKGVRSILYMGSGYATNATGKGLASHFDLWMYPQYPGAYQLGPDGESVEIRRAMNRSAAVPERVPIARTTTSWPPEMTPWLPSGVAATGWSRPHIWQFTDNWNGWDASISPLTLDQLAGGGQPIPQEETDMAQRDLLPGLDKMSQLILIPKSGGYTTFEAFTDNTLTLGTAVKAFDPVTIRVAIRKSNGYWQVVDKLVVGRGPKDTTQKQFTIKLDDPKSTAVNVTRVTGTGDEPVVITAY